MNINTLRHKKNGEEKPFGANTAYLAMGLNNEDVAHKKAQRILGNKRKESEREIYAVERADEYAQDSANQAWEAFALRNPYVDRIKLVSAGHLVHKDDRWHVTASERDKVRLMRNGWAEPTPVFLTDAISDSR